MLPLAIFGTVISLATAQNAAPGKVVQRQDGMKAMANAAKSIDAMFKDLSPYDARAFKAAAETILAHSGLSLSALFHGSGATPGSKASPSIETDRQQFDKLAKSLAPTRPRCLSQLTEIPTHLDQKRGCKREMPWEADRSQER